MPRGQFKRPLCYLERVTWPVQAYASSFNRIAGQLICFLVTLWQSLFSPRNSLFRFLGNLEETL